jgi:hypothetical protein
MLSVTPAVWPWVPDTISKDGKAVGRRSRAWIDIGHMRFTVGRSRDRIDLKSTAAVIARAERDTPARFTVKVRDAPPETGPREYVVEFSGEVRGFWEHGFRVRDDRHGVGTVAIRLFRPSTIDLPESVDLLTQVFIFDVANHLMRTTETW